MLVPKEVFEGITAVRDSGLTNMFAVSTVIDLCYDMGYDDAAEWVANAKGDYVKGIFEGFESE
jgi:hypothetical protein